MGDKKIKEVIGKDGASMIAPHPVKTKKSDRLKEDELLPVETVAKEAGLPDWEIAGLMRAAGWLPGKQVTAGEFDFALTKFRKRPQGGGKI